MRAAVLLLAALLFLIVLAYVLEGCSAFASRKPVDYAADLAWCEAISPEGPDGWASYTPCCVAANARYPMPDGSPRDDSACYPTGKRP